MDELDSNRDAVDGLLDRIGDVLDLDGGLGETLLDLAVEGMLDDIASEKAPDGGRWDLNAPKYRRKKERAGVTDIGVGVGPGSGEMLSEANLRGERSISPDEAVMEYGTTEAARKKLQWFTKGSSGPGDGERSGAPNQPPRPVYGLSEKTQAEIDRAVRAHLDESLKEIG